MIEYLKNLGSMLIQAGFVCVPVLFVFACWNLRKFWANTRLRLAFFAACLPLTLVYLILGTGAKRYLLIPWLLLACLSGAGLANIVTFIRHIPGIKRLSARSLLVGITVMICLGSAMKLVVHPRKHYIGEFIEEVSRNFPEETVLYAVDWARGRTVANAFTGAKNFEFFEFEKWDDAIKTSFVKHQTEDRTFYFMTRVPRGYDENDFRQWFRENFYICPLDLVKKTCFQGYTYLLLRFNGKTLDGIQKCVRQDILPYFNDNMLLRAYHDEWTIADYSELFEKAQPDVGSFVSLHQGTFIKNRYLIRKMFLKSKVDKTIFLYNALMWPQDNCGITLDYQENVTEIAQKSNVREMLPIQTRMFPVMQHLPVSDAPLLLKPVQLIVPQNQKQIFPKSFVPAFFDATDRFDFLPSDVIELADSREQSIRLAVVDKPLAVRTECSSRVIRADISGISTYAGKILVIDDASSADAEFSDLLRQSMPRATVDSLTLPRTAYSILNQPNSELEANRKSYDFILLTGTYEMMMRPWIIPFQSDAFAEDYLTKFIDALHRNHPTASVGILLPPPPPPYECRYPLIDSAQLARLSHYRTCAMLERWCARHADGGVTLIPSYAVINPQTDYPMVSDAEHIASSYAVNKSANRKIADMVLAWMQYSMNIKN